MENEFSMTLLFKVNKFQEPLFFPNLKGEICLLYTVSPFDDIQFKIIPIHWKIYLGYSANGQSKVFLNMILNCIYTLFEVNPVDLDCSRSQMHVCREVRPHPTTSVLNMTLNYLMVGLQSWSFGECRIPTSLPLFPRPLYGIHRTAWQFKWVQTNNWF